MTNFLPEGFLINTRENIHAISSYEAFHKAYTDKMQLEARAIYCDREHNLHIDFGFIHGIIPREECAVGIKDGTIRDIAIMATDKHYQGHRFVYVLLQAIYCLDFFFLISS